MYTTVYVQKGKRVKPSLAAAGDNSPRFNRLYIMDKTTGTRYLIDTGSDLYPPQKHRQHRVKTEPYQLYAANGLVITTYGMITLHLV